jgi:uncharacterized protein (DUF1778 family)
MTATALRLDVEMNDPAGVQQVHRLKARLSAGNAELVREALMLLDWATEQVAEGRHLASVEPDGHSVHTRFTMPLLERARHARSLLLEPGAFDGLVAALKAPPAPSDELRALMSGSGKTTTRRPRRRAS